MGIRDDVLCLCLADKSKSGHDLFTEALEYSHFSVTMPGVLDALKELSEKGLVREFTEEDERDGLSAKLRMLVTPLLYHNYRLTKIGLNRRRMLMSRRRISDLKMMRTKLRNMTKRPLT